MKTSRKLTLLERLYIPEIAKGMSLTFRHIFRPKFTLQYPEERDVPLSHFRGMPALVTDQDGRTKCVACKLCEYVCPPNAILIEAREIEGRRVEKGPKNFEINMLRCIMCGFCEEVCPEEAIFLTEKFELAAGSRDELIFNRDQLLTIGGTRQDSIRKWG
jgi:NADH-quinone oxidoreductase subunit I